MSELSEMKWNEWFDGFDLNEPYGKIPMVRRKCPYQSDLEQPYGKVPMVDWECPYQNDLDEHYESVPIKMNGIDEIWTRISEMKWIEVKWVIWRIWLWTL